MNNFTLAEGFPKILYKYFPPDRQDFFFEPCLRFTPPHELNDPFEATHSIFVNGVPISDEVLNENFTNIDNGFAHLGIGVLSLSENPLDLLMHAHYAKDHKGFVVGFEVRSLLHTFYHIGMNLVFDRAIYTDSRPIFELSDVLNSNIKPEKFLYKSKCWEYESEWRFIVTHVYNYEKLVEQENAEAKRVRGLVNIAKESIREIYLCERPHPNLLYNAPNFHDANSFSRLFLCYLDKRKYSLYTRELKRRNGRL